MYYVNKILYNGYKNFRLSSSIPIKHYEKFVDIKTSLIDLKVKEINDISNRIKHILKNKFIINDTFFINKKYTLLEEIMFDNVK